MNQDQIDILRNVLLKMEMKKLTVPIYIKYNSKCYSLAQRNVIKWHLFYKTIFNFVTEYILR